MFYGTNFFYKFLYFITAMCPTYPLFLLQINAKFKLDMKEYDYLYLKFGINIYYQCLIIILALFLLSILLNVILKRQYFHSFTDRVDHEEEAVFLEHNLKEINGTVTNFLLGVLLPAVFIVEYSLITALLTFLCIQFLIYTLMIRSTDIFPNILLILLGINLCKTSDDKYVFTFKSKRFNNHVVYPIGESGKTKIYITMYER